MIVSLLLPSAMSPERRGVPSFLHGSQRFKSKDGRDADTVTKADPARRGRFAGTINIKLARCH